MASGGPSFPAEWLFVGPAGPRRDALTEFPPAWLDPALKHVLVTLESRTPVGACVLRAAVAAATRLPDRLQAIVAAPDCVLELTAPHILIGSDVSPADLLPHADAVVSDAGHEAVCATLAHGVPLVLAPMRGDQGIIADRVMNAGAGVQVKAGRVDADHIADALLTVLDEPSYRCAAQRLQASFVQRGAPRRLPTASSGSPARARAWLPDDFRFRSDGSTTCQECRRVAIIEIAGIGSAAQGLDMVCSSVQSRQFCHQERWHLSC